MAGRALENSQHREGRRERGGLLCQADARRTYIFLVTRHKKPCAALFTITSSKSEITNRGRTSLSFGVKVSGLPRRHRGRLILSIFFLPSESYRLVGTLSRSEGYLSCNEKRGRREKNGHWTKRDWLCLTRARRSRLLRNAGLFYPQKSLRRTSAVLCILGQFGLVLEAVVTHRD